MTFRLTYLNFVIALTLSFSAISQKKIGLVLSGGGATGFAHIGVLKALEEENIKIDYITGTSAGSFVGGLYASGYSPQEIEEICLSESFNLMVKGKMKQKDKIYFYNRNQNAGVLKVKFSKDSIKYTTLPTNYIGSALLDFEMLRLFGPASLQANKNFDSLFIPYRAVASDIYTKSTVVFSEGDLNKVIRASMTFPFYLKPIRINNVLLFDGGLYNNFPIDVMIKDFNPDIIIGSNVSYNEPPPHEDDLLSTLKNMLISHTDYSLHGKEGVIISPTSDIKTFQFDRVQEAIDSGYSATKKQIKEIKKILDKENFDNKVDQNRQAYKSKTKRKNIGSIQVKGLKKGQSKYVTKKILNTKKSEQIDLDLFRKRYFKLLGDNQFQFLYPTLNNLDSNYQIEVYAKAEKDFYFEVGGHLTTRPVSMGYIGIGYQNLSSFSFSTHLNAYFGKFYNSVKAELNFGVQSKWPIELSPYFVLNRWDYFNSYFTFFSDEQPTFLVQQEIYYGLKFKSLISNESALSFDFQGAGLRDDYYQRNFNNLDTADITKFSNFSIGGLYEFNTLNRKQFASSGHLIRLEGRWVIGRESWYPGSTAFSKVNINKNHSWFFARLKYEGYLVQKGLYRLGMHAEGVYSTQSFFSNYTSTILNTPSYEPIPDMKTFFLDNYRANQYLAVGLINIFTIKDFIDFRLEGYFYQPVQQLIANEFNQVSYNKIFANQYFVAAGSLIYHSPVGPLRVSVEYLSGKSPSPWNIQVSYGFVIFNKKAIH